jgi:hemerythrin superfamily protein
MQSEINELPVRGNDAVEILTNDHQTIKTLLSQLTQAAASTQRMQTLERLKAALTIHNATEENLVYPALKLVARKKSEAEKLYHETAEADAMVFELDTMLKQGDDEGASKVAEKLEAAILEHIEDEEEKAFPHLQENAEPQQQQMLTQSVQEFRSKMRFGDMPATRTRTETAEIDQAARSRST